MPNRLASETSPYLLQHRDNPVDWFPWGTEALARARGEDRPILLSIGYSACHWCHVMERESFEDEATARLMNERFVNIKVDREERPDLDSIYMTAVQQMTGRGGWPMTVFLTPDGAPFYGGTYYPPEPRHGLPSFRQVLEGISEAYAERRDQVDRSADELKELLHRSTTLAPPSAALDGSVLDQAYERLAELYDPRNGGFGGAPKFPQPMVLEFLLRHGAPAGRDRAVAMADHTLEMMWRGGMYDHLAGGFHRYSVDDRWLVPHFEKMLYDNALLARTYLNAFLATGKPGHRTVAREVLDYVAREMTSPEGGFYSAQDADSEGEEGRYYVWDAAEIDDLLGDATGALFRERYGVTGSGNFEGRNILHRQAARASGAGEPTGEAPGADTGAEEVIERAREVLLRARSRRTPPARDEKVLTAWNALMMRSFADAAAALGDERYLRLAVANAELLLGSLRRDGKLLRTYRDGDARIPGFLEDHALLVDALVSLYQASFDTRWLAEARALAETMIAGFWDDAAGVFYDAAHGTEALVVRPRDYHDNATPSGSSAAVSALLRLAALTGEEEHRAIAGRVLESFASLLAKVPQGFGELLCAAAFHLGPPREVAIVGSPDDPRTQELLNVVRRRYRPATVLALRDGSAPDAGTDGDAARAVPLLAGRELVDGKPAAYVCERFTCRRPVTRAADLEAELA